jgi:hypothetical protein
MEAVEEDIIEIIAASGQERDRAEVRIRTLPTYINALTEGFEEFKKKFCLVRCSCSKQLLVGIV